MAAANLQTVIVSKRLAKTRKAAQDLARPHANRIYTSRETDQSWRFRQRPPSDFVKGSFRTYHVPGHPGITLVYGKLRKSKNPSGKKKMLTPSQRRLQWQGQGEGIEGIDRDWDFWLVMQDKIAKAKSEGKLQVFALSTRRRKIQSPTIMDLIMGALADRARELRLLRTKPSPRADERYYQTLVGDYPKSNPKLRQTSRKMVDDLIVARYVAGPFRVIVILGDKVDRVSIYLDKKPVFDKSSKAPYGWLPGDRLKRAVATAQKFIDEQGVSARRASLRAVANPSKKAKKKTKVAKKKRKKTTKKKTKRKTKKKTAKKRKEIGKWIKLKDPKILPDPGPCAWDASALEFAVKPNGKKKPRWAKVDEKGNWLWEEGYKKEWLWLWSEKYHCVIAIRRPKGLKGGPGRPPQKGTVIRTGGAAKSFERFSGRAAEQTQAIKLEGIPLQKWGDCVHFCYRSDKWEKGPRRKLTDYIHDTTTGEKVYMGPTLRNPKVILCFGGRLTKTERGYVF